MSNQLRALNEYEIGVFQGARQTGIETSIANLLVVMGVYSIVNRCSWWPVLDDSPELEIPGVEALKQMAVDLGRHCYLWPGAYDIGSLTQDRLVDPLGVGAFDGGGCRLGLSNVGQNRNNVKIYCADLAISDGNRTFGLNANTGTGGMDLDASIKLELRFAEGFRHVAGLVANDTIGSELAWTFLLKNCEAGSDMAGSPTMLEEGWTQ